MGLLLVLTDKEKYGVEEDIDNNCLKQDTCHMDYRWDVPYLYKMFGSKECVPLQPTTDIRYSVKDDNWRMSRA